MHEIGSEFLAFGRGAWSCHVATEELGAARNWHSEFRVWGCFWDEGTSVHEIGAANFVFGGAPGVWERHFASEEPGSAASMWPPKRGVGPCTKLAPPC